ncbi:MAG TPA: DUF1015 domain-containing protein [Polyangia bacterium]|jgi:uncharacterized protein (DUF1015 family)|nr:DUF1015 domain-containing protein [Polyangia bacterium]
MADITPFSGLRYATERVGDLASVLCPPYDVIGEEERRELEARHPENVVRLELPRGMDDARYTTAARLLGSWTTEGILRADARPAFYLYEQQFGYGGQRYTRRGFFAAVRLEPFERRVVLPHEKTLSAPKEDRKKLLRATHTQISPVFGLFRDAGGAARAIIDEVAAGAPAVDATTTNDGVRHRVWVINGAPAVDGLRTLLADKQILIADGHHRYETMLGMAPELRSIDVPAGAAASDFVMMFLARAEDPGLLVLPTHRLVKDLPDFSFDGLVAAAGAAFDIAQGDETTAAAIEARLTRQGENAEKKVVFAVRAPGRPSTVWMTLKPILDLSALGPPALRNLDVTVLHGVILGPLLAIDAEALAKQSFLTYTHDTAEALARVERGDVQAAFFMNPTKVEQVLAACEAGFVLPQKSTYFLPKLATGLVMYRLDGAAPRLAR